MTKWTGKTKREERVGQRIYYCEGGGKGAKCCPRKLGEKQTVERPKKKCGGESGSEPWGGGLFFSPPRKKGIDAQISILQEEGE